MKKFIYTDDEAQQERGARARKVTYWRRMKGKGAPEESVASSRIFARSCRDMHSHGGMNRKCLQTEHF